MAENSRDMALRARRLAGFACTQEDRARLLQIADTFERQAIDEAGPTNTADPGMSGSSCAGLFPAG